MGYGGEAFQGRVFLLLTFCKQNASLQQLLSHMAGICLSTNCPRANSIIKSVWPHTLGKVELGATWIWHGLVPGKCWLNALQKTKTVAMPDAMHCTQSGWLHQIPDSPGVCSGVCPGVCSGVDESSCCVSTCEVLCTLMHFRDDSDLS